MNTQDLSVLDNTTLAKNSLTREITQDELAKINKLLVNSRFTGGDFVRGAGKSKRFRLHNLYIAIKKELETQEQDDMISGIALERIFEKLDEVGSFTHIHEDGRVLVL